MVSGESIYKCPICNATTKAAPGKRISCLTHNIIMSEEQITVQKGAWSVKKTEPEQDEPAEIKQEANQEKGNHSNAKPKRKRRGAGKK